MNTPQNPQTAATDVSTETTETVQTSAETPAVSPARKRKRRRYVPNPQYIGRAEHIVKQNTPFVLEAFRTAVQARAAMLVLTITLPEYKHTGTIIQSRVEARLPLCAGFRVVTTDDCIFEERYECATWQEAIDWLCENEHTCPRNRRWQIHRIAPGYYSTDDVELLQFNRIAFDQPAMVSEPEG